MAIAVEIVPLFEALEEQARERQRESGGDRKSEYYQESVNQKIEKPIQTHNERSTAHKAAVAMGTNRQYIADALAILGS